jgi:hypothetical protein
MRDTYENTPEPMGALPAVGVARTHPTLTPDAEPSVPKMKVPDTGIEYGKDVPAVPFESRAANGVPSSPNIASVPVSVAPDVFKRSRRQVKVRRHVLQLFDELCQERRRFKRGGPSMDLLFGSICCVAYRVLRQEF